MSEQQNSPPRWRWIVPGLLLVVGTLFMLPGAIEVVRTPHRWHGFEVDWSWYFLYASPVVLAAGAAMIYMGSVRR